jgi:type IV secretory pathway TrbD component
VAGAFLLVLGFQAFIWSLKQLAGCTSFNLLQYNFSLASLLIYLSLFLAALSFIFLPLLILRRIFLASSARKISLLTGLTAILIFGLLAWLVMKPAGLNPVWQLIFLWSLALVSARSSGELAMFFQSILDSPCPIFCHPQPDHGQNQAANRRCFGPSGFFPKNLGRNGP